MLLRHKNSQENLLILLTLLILKFTIKNSQWSLIFIKVEEQVLLKRASSQVCKKFRNIAKRDYEYLRPMFFVIHFFFITIFNFF